MKEEKVLYVSTIDQESGDGGGVDRETVTGVHIYVRANTIWSIAQLLTLHNSIIFFLLFFFQLHSFCDIETMTK